MEDSQIDGIARKFADLIAEDNASPSANVPTPMARIGGAIREALAAMTKERDDQAEAVRVLKRGVLAGQMARACLRRCPSTSGGAGGQTVGEGLSRMRFHNVPLSIFDDLSAADDAIWDNPIARAAVEGER